MTTILGAAIIAVTCGAVGFAYWAHRPPPRHAAPKAPGAGDARDSRARDKTPGGRTAPPPVTPAGPACEHCGCELGEDGWCGWCSPRDDRWADTIHEWWKEDRAERPVTPEPDLPELPQADYLTAPIATHACPDVPQAAECEPDPAYDRLYRDTFPPQPYCPSCDAGRQDIGIAQTCTCASGPATLTGVRADPGCALCGSPGHKTTSHDQYTAAQRQATAAETQAAGVIGAAMMLARLAAQPALPRLGSLDHLELRLWTTDTGTLPAICGADDLGGA